ncbi:hypothetical protein KQY10_03830 [Leptospira interrogans]|uniref:DUF1574 domain-containing protein n=1 Tax=Leptospira interrogans serovar Hardjo str. Norma TaxID=1279460 RepID=A0A0M4NL23_LEPIR|nr:hypothetical protein [Leptospira interrogans]AKH76767.1 hypothetical protein BRAT_06705 [Leptospira interrogans serovar Bratislava]ALE40047.1 hypothetical protein G436_2882 [Leptospira interrogans serovar Hardjo str. Norma]ALO01071.1 hypothetical protein LIH_11975 [Leptospira interrogans serovar Hardjo-prajitno]KLO75082.1 Uncharacterized protein AAY48_3924 [Leptospira interrogans serovar Muenchen]KWV23637.1 hypothetical protein LA733_2487 [Leptospira interrogans]
MKKINVISGFHLNLVRNKIFGLVICTLSIIMFQLILFPHLLFFQEKNSFLYDRLSHLNSFLYTKSNLNSEAPIVFIGDSQILSGIHPQELEIKIGRPIWFLPRPSEQPEGMLLRWKEYEQKIKIKPSLVVVNGSVFSIADMDVASAHRSLELNYDSFHFEIFTKTIFRNFYLKNISSGLYYLLGRIFPFLRLNASVSTTLKIIGEGDEFSYSEKKIENLLSGNPIEKWRFNLNRNRFLEIEYSKNKGYLDWGKELSYDGVCVPNKNSIPLPPNAEAALNKTRVSSLNAWRELFSYLKSQNVPILAISIPFRPDFEKKISTLTLMPLWESILMEETIPYWKVEDFLFEQSDFGDYTHLNTCGMKKFVPVLAERISNFNL